MKNAIGKENSVLVRDASSAFAAAAAWLGSASPPSRTDSFEAMTIFWFGHITSHTFRNMTVPSSAPSRIPTDRPAMM